MCCTSLNLKSSKQDVISENLCQTMCPQTRTLHCGEKLIQVCLCLYCILTEVFLRASLAENFALTQRRLTLLALPHVQSAYGRMFLF